MRLLFAYHTLFPELAGGIEARNRELAAALVRRGHRVTLAARTAWSLPSLPEGTDILRLGPLPAIYNRRGRRSRRAALQLAIDLARLDLSGFDAVETASVPYAHLPGLAAKCRLARVPLIVSWYEYWGRYWRRYMGGPLWRIYALGEWLTAPLGSCAVATCELTRGRLAARRGARPTRILRCGLRVGAVREAAAGAPTGPPLIYAGRLLREKRLDLLLGAVRLLPKRDGRLLTIIGEGPDRSRLEGLAHQLGVAERVLFRGHLAAQEEVWNAIGGSQIAVQPSEREGFGLFPLESMAIGLPVVYCASSESALPELVRPGLDGCCVEAEEGALAKVLEELLANGELRWTLGESARRRAEGYDWDVVAGEFEDVVLAAGAAGRGRATA